MKEINGNLTAKGLRIALVASRFNSFLVEQLVKGAADAFARLGGDDKNLTLVRVPGAYEIPVTAKRLAATKAYDAVVGLGAVVQGATAHAGLICQTTARAFSEIALETGVPVAAIAAAAPPMQTTLVLCARLSKKRSVAHPATTMPALPPTISKTKQSVVAEASERPFVSMRSTIPQSSAATRTV